MDQFELIRTASRVYGKSVRQIRRETGHHRATIRKALAGTEPKYRRQKEPRAPVMDSVAKIIEQWLMGDRQQPRKQRHTARQVYTRLLEEHQFKGAEVSVRRWVRQWKAACPVLRGAWVATGEAACPGWNCEPTSQPKGRSWKPSIYRLANRWEHPAYSTSQVGCLRRRSGPAMRNAG